MKDRQVSVIGAGITGLCCAVELARRGCAVEVIDRNADVGPDCCSWYAGGMLAPWCELESAEPLIARLGIESIDRWRQWVPELVQMKGTLVVAHGRDLPDLKRFARRTERFEQVGANRVADLEPDLAGRFQAGLYFPDEGHFDPRLVLPKLVRTLRDLGVSVRFGEAAAESPGTGWRIDCRGLAAQDELPDLRGVKGEMLLLEAPDVTLNRTVRLLHPRIPLYVVPRENNLFMVGATMIENEERHRVTVRSALEMLSGAYALHPGFGEAEIVEIGVDARPAFPDNLPRIRRKGRTIHVNGLYRHGYLTAPSLAARVADYVLDGIVDADVMDEIDDQSDREQRTA